MNRPPFSSTLYLALLAQLLFALAFTVPMPIIPLYITDDLGAAEQWIGTATLFVAWSSVALRLPGGTLSDRYGRRRIMISGAILGLFASAILILTHDVYSFLLGRLFGGMSLGLYTTAAKALIADLAPPSRRGEAMGLSNASFSSAVVISPLIGEALKNAFNFQSVWIASGVIYVLMFGLTWLLPNTRPTASAAPNIRREISATLNERGLWAALILMVGSGPLMTVMYTFYPLFAERKNLFEDAPAFMSVISMSLGLSIWSLVDALVEPAAGRLSDRVGRQFLIPPSLLIVIIGAIMLSQANSTFFTYTSIAILALGWGAMRSMADAITQDAVAPLLRGTGSALLYTGFDLYVGLSAQLLSTSIDGDDFSVFFVAVILTALLSGIFGFLSSLRLTTYDQRNPNPIQPSALGD